MDFSLEKQKIHGYNHVTVSNIGGTNGPYNSRITDAQQQDDLSTENRDRQRTEHHVQQHRKHTGGNQKNLNSGFIDYRDIQENGKKKKEYCITEAGKQEFCKWINSPIDSAGIKCPELSKIYFMGFSKQENRFENTQAYITEPELFMHISNCIWK